MSILLILLKFSGSVSSESILSTSSTHSSSVHKSTFRKETDMAYVTECRFCNKHALNHDHDGCARDFGEGLEKKVLVYMSLHPSEFLPKRIQDQYSSARWKWYLEYLGRERISLSVRLHMKKMREKILRDAKAIIQSRWNKRKFDRHNTSCDGESFVFRIDIEVVVTPQAVY